ncbi:hypothetical protein [Arthrobacter sp. B10-11]|uniref:hypothetical protein n=1 Tax=Arthrobacter sp. B10-11 TaxID=3081160 RepID=UPI0029557715|nr:hypothetical protein [Arthrobacter sp. B10-11]MDV8149028.1 hypothetical protein [Arthrobacter sp. B10-11]
MADPHLHGTGPSEFPRATAAQNPRPGITYRPVRDAPPISVFLASWKDDPSVLIADFTRLAQEAFIPDQPEL